MRFVPNNRGVTGRSPFCSLNGGRHGLMSGGGKESRCGECGQDDLTDTTSDHMGTRNGLVILCLPCSRTYQEFWALEQVAP